MNEVVTNCWEAFDGGPRPIWDQSVYQMLRETYVEVMGEDNKSSINLTAASSFEAPCYVNHSPEKGRGLYASSLIKTGQQIEDTSSRAVFTEDDEAQFRDFLALIGYDLACDILQWAYVERLHDDGEFIVAVELSEGALINEISKGEVRNAGWCGTDQVLRELTSCENSDITYATRDIQKGEEVVTDYCMIHHVATILWFDELENAAWWDIEEEDSSDDYDSCEDDDDDDASW